MTKAKVILVFFSIIGIVSLLTYFNYDRILNYFTNREWEIAGSIGKLELESYIDICGTSSNFIVVSNNFIQGYSKDAKENFDKTVSLKNAVMHSSNDYAIIAEKDSSNVYVVCGDEIIWNKEINNASILGAYINKNGYAAVIYSLAGYKSLIKVYSNTGEELFTNYFASTYAIDVAISNDNKTLAVAEVDTNGINVESNLKLVDIQAVSEKTVKKHSLDNNELITDIEYNEDNDVVIMTDYAVKIFDGSEISTVVKYKEQNILMADINNRKNVVTVAKEEDGLFNSSCLVNIYDFNLNAEVKTYELTDTPIGIYTLKNVVAIDMGNEIIFLNSSGHFLKKCEYKGQLKEIKLIDDGNVAVLIFRNTADFIKVGGI